MLKVVAMKNREKSQSFDQAGSSPKSPVFLVDGEYVTRSNTIFLFKLQEYDVVAFDSLEMALNRLEQVWGTDMTPFCLVINHGDLNQDVRRFLESLDTKSFHVPVLIVDREKFNLRRDDYCRGISPDFPLFICRADELVEFTSNLHILKKRLRRFSSAGSPTQRRTGHALL